MKDKIVDMIVRTPVLFFLGLAVSVVAHILGASVHLAASLLCVWFAACGVGLGLYMTLCTGLALVWSITDEEEDDDTGPMWPLLAGRLLYVVLIFVSYPVAAFLFWSAQQTDWDTTRLAIAAVLLVCGLIGHSTYLRK